MVSASFFLSAATLNTQKCARTNSTYLFHAGESDTDDEKSDTVANTQSIVAVEMEVEGSISTLALEISELDKIGFDENLLLNESDHI
jgi:hypothetical protein